MCPPEDSEHSPPTLLLILSIPLPQTLALPCFPHQEEAVAVGAVEALEEAVLLAVASEEEAAEAGNRVYLINRPLLREINMKSGRSSFWSLASGIPKGGNRMRSDKKIIWKRLGLYSGMVFLPLILLFFIPITGFAQGAKEDEKEALDTFSYLIENGAKMIRENDFEKVFGMISELPQEKKVDFRIRVIENFAYLKGYLVIKKNEYGKKWQIDYKPMVYTLNKTAISILLDLLKDNDPYIRAFTARALGYLGDHTALADLERLASEDPNQKVRSRAREGYHRISGKRLPFEYVSPKN
jgi:hypothetical protein